MRIRTTAAAGIAAGLTLSLAACSPDSDDGANSIEWWVGDWDEEVATELVEEYTANNPDIEINMVITTWETMDDRIRVALDSGDAPDLITELTSRIPIYMREEQLVDISGWYGDDMPLDDFYDAAIETVTAEGGIYAVPYRWDAGAMIYNAQMLEDAGVDGPPATWEEVEEAAAALAEIGEYAYGWPYGDEGNARVRWLNEYYTQGGEFIENEDGSVAIDAEASERALETLQWGFEEGFVTPSSLEASNTDLQNLLINEQIAFYYDGAYAVEPIRDAGIDIGTALWPGPDGPGTASADGFSFMVPEGTEHMEELEPFVQFLAEAENQAVMTETFPARESAEDHERFDDPLLDPFVEQHAEHALERPSYVGWDELAPTIFSALQSVALGDQTTSEANQAILDHAELVLRTE